MIATCTGLGFTTFEAVRPVLFVGAVNVSDDGPKVDYIESSTSISHKG